MATADEQIQKMKAFIEGGAEGNELSEGLTNQLMAVAVTLSPGALPSAVNKGLTGKTFRRVVNAIPNISMTDVEILADWLGEEYPDALPKFMAPLPSFNFTPKGVTPSAGPIGVRTDALVDVADAAEHLEAAMAACALKQQLPTGAACLMLSFALHSGRLLGRDGTFNCGFGEDPRMTTAYKNMAKLEMGTLTAACKKGTGLALDMYFEGLMEQLQDNDEPSMQSRVAVWYNLAKSTFPDVGLRIEYIQAYLNKHAGKGLPETIDMMLVLRLKVMRSEAHVTALSAEPPKAEEAQQASIQSGHVARLEADLKAARQSQDDLRARIRNDANGSDRTTRSAGITCRYCKKDGHIEKNCLTKKREKKAEAKDAEDEAQDDE